jgi:hypothetical protein
MRTIGFEMRRADMELTPRLNYVVVDALELRGVVALSLSTPGCQVPRHQPAEEGRHQPWRLKERTGFVELPDVDTASPADIHRLAARDERFVDRSGAAGEAEPTRLGAGL